MTESTVDTTAGAADAATGVFLTHRTLLFSIVYNLLGFVADTEDVLQETWLSWARRNDADRGTEPGDASGAGIREPRAYLVRIYVVSNPDKLANVSSSPGRTRPD